MSPLRAGRILFTLAGLVLLCAGCDRADRPNVLLFVVDTLRADALGSYGNPLPTSPQLDALARRGMRFEQVIAPAPQTAPSHATMFTSSYPSSHGIWNAWNPSGEHDLHPELADEAVTLAEVFEAAGYATAAFADGGWVTKWRGFDQGFEVFDSEYLGVRNRIAAASDWLRETDRPFFLLVHTYEVHAPYLPPPGTEAPFAKDYDGFLRGLVDEMRPLERDGGLGALHAMMINPVRENPAPDQVAFLRALYHAEVLEVDRAFGELLETLRRLQLESSTLVVVTSDHGEEFGEQGHFGHEQVYEPLLRIPLFAAGPGVPQAVRRPGPAELTDLMPTLLRYAGLEVPRSAVGRDLELRSPAAPRPDPARFIVSENSAPPQAAVRRGSLKAVFHEGEGRRAELFDLADDPGETLDLSGTAQAAAFLTEAAQALESHRQAARRHREEHGLRPRLHDRDSLTGAERKALIALGYLVEKDP